MFCTDAKEIKAAKPHRCTWCGQSIEKGEKHSMWKSVDGGWFTNRMHPECADACAEECREWNDDEYQPYDNERPALALAAKEAK